MSTNIEHLKSGLDRIKVIMYELLDNSRTTIQLPRQRNAHFLDNYSETPPRANRRTIYKWIKDYNEKELELQAKVYREYTTWFELFCQSIDRSASALKRSEINQTNRFILSCINKSDNAPSSISEAKTMFESKTKLFYDILSISSKTQNTVVRNTISDNTMPTQQTSRHVDNQTTYDTLSDILTRLKKMSNKTDEGLKRDKLDRCVERLKKIATDIFHGSPDYFDKLDSIQIGYTLFRLKINNESGIDHEDVSKVIAVVETMMDELRRTLPTTSIDVKNNEVEKLIQHLKSKLRKMILKKPSNEKDVQDSIEQILIANGYTKGIDYGREVGRVQIANKEVIPDFIFPKLNLALEAKLSKTTTQSKRIVDEINADISSYSRIYSQLLFVVYDFGSIRDEDEYKNGIANDRNIHLIIVKD